MSTNTKLAQAAGQEPYTREQHFALREAHCIAAGDAYFEVRPHLDAYGQRRSAFDDGFARGFDKGTELAEARAADRAAHESLAALASQPAARVALTWDQFVAACEAEYGEDFAPEEFVDVPEDQKEELMRVVRMVERAHGISEYALTARQQAQVPMCSEHAVAHAVNQARSESHKQGDAAFQQAFARAMWRQFNAMLAAAPQAAQPEPFPDTEAVTACWQDFGRTEDFRRAVKWSQDGEIPGALFVAFRAGLRAASPKARCDCGKKAAADCEKWEPGCDLGNSPEHARVVRIDLKPEQALPLKDRPDFIAGYDAGLKDGRACERRDAAEQAAQAVPAGFVLVPVEFIEAGQRVAQESAHEALALHRQRLESELSETRANVDKAPAAQSATVEEWERELSAVMPLDFKDWWQNDRHEWPAVAAAVIRSQRADCELGWKMAAEAAPSAEPLTDEQIAEGRYRMWAAELEESPEPWAFLQGARWAQKACAEAWGVKLGTSGGEVQK